MSEYKKALAESAAELGHAKEVPKLITDEYAPIAKQSQERRLRCGLNNRELELASIRHVSADEAERLCGLRESGLWIPYLDCDGYGRLRIDRPSGKRKYHQQADSSVHVFVPPGAQRPTPNGDLVLVEGEFKSLALTSAGIPAVGISGFFGFARGERLVPELQALIDRARPNRILFAGDSDTALNAQFSHAAVKLAGLTDIPVLLPRLPIDGPKAWDDLRDELELDDEKLRDSWQEAVDEAEPVKPGTRTGKLAFRLLRREQERLKAGHFAGLSEEDALDRLVAIAAVAEKANPLLLGKVVALVEEAGLAKRQEFKRAVKVYQQKQREEAATKEAQTLTAEEEDEIVEQFFVDPHANYFRRVGEEFRPIPCRQDMLALLASLGAPRKSRDGEENPPNLRLLLRIVEERSIDYAGPLCGRKAGLHEENGLRFLVTTSPKLIEGEDDPDSGAAMFSFVRGLLRDDDEQIGRFYAWLQRGREAIRHPDKPLPGQALVLIGPAGCGKSLMQELITKCLGGRSADGGPHLTGEEEKNTASLFRAEHLLVSDENVRSGADRRKFRDRLKAVVARPGYKLRAMYKDALELRPIWRCTISANPDVGSAGVIPSPVEDESLADKLIMLACEAPSCLPGDAPEDRQRFWDGLIAALPGFLGWIDRTNFPEELRDDRWGVSPYVHPEIHSLLQAADPDGPALEIIAEFLHRQPLRTFTGTSPQLLKELRKTAGAAADEHIGRRERLDHILERMQRRPRWKDLVAYEGGRSEHRNPVRVYTLRYGKPDDAKG